MLFVSAAQALRLRSMLMVALMLPSLFLTTACEDDEDEVTPTAESLQYRNLPAPQLGGQGQPISGPFKYFNLTTNDSVPAASITATNWDIAFRGSTIIVNGGTATSPTRGGNAGVAVLSGVMGDFPTVPANQVFNQDTPNALAITPASGQGWYTYNGFSANPADGGYLTPRAVVLMFRLATSNRFAKLEILSYYQTNPDGSFRDPSTWFANGTHITNSAAYQRYYSFNYVLTPVGSTSFQ